MWQRARRRRHGDQIGHADGPEDPWQVGGQALERVVASNQCRRELPEVLVGAALPAAGDRRRRTHRLAVRPRRLHEPQDHQPVEKGIRRLLFGLESKSARLASDVIVIPDPL